MYKLLIFCLALLLAGCTNPKRIDQLPPVKSPETSSQVFLKNMFTEKLDIRRLTFKLDGTPIYRFGDTRQFSFYLDTGTYLFSYDHGSENCETNVYIKPRGNYIFQLGPGCNIEMMSGE